MSISGLFAPHYSLACETDFPYLYFSLNDANFVVRIGGTLGQERRVSGISRAVEVEAQD